MGKIGKDRVLLDVQISVGSVDAMTMVARNNQVAPEKAIRPFDANREGFVLSEGVGVQNACVVMGAI